jgi:TRAP-type mannitol/chloroaromatic compound transport system substrate-binding protein
VRWATTRSLASVLSLFQLRGKTLSGMEMVDMIEDPKYELSMNNNYYYSCELLNRVLWLLVEFGMFVDMDCWISFAPIFLHG